MKIKILTSVDRDDLKDMGSIIWAETVNAVRRISPEQRWKPFNSRFSRNSQTHR